MKEKEFNKKKVFNVNFSQTFNLRKSWLFVIKNYIVENQGELNIKDNSYLKIGLGKNMISSLKNWLKVLDFIDDNGVVSDKFFEFNDLFANNKVTLYYLHSKLCKEHNATFWHYIFNIKDNDLIDDYDAEKFQNYMKIEHQRVYQLSSILKEFHIFKTHFLGSDQDTIITESLFKGLDLVEKIDGKLYKSKPNFTSWNDSMYSLIIWMIYDEINQIEFQMDAIVENKILDCFNIKSNNMSELMFLLEKNNFVSITRDSGLNVVKINEKKLIKNEIDIIKMINGDN